MASKKVSAVKLAALQAKRNAIVKGRIDLQKLQAEFNSLALEAKEEAGFDDLESNISQAGEELPRGAGPRPVGPVQPGPR